jgi:hypothetical protein
MNFYDLFNLCTTFLRKGSQRKSSVEQSGTEIEVQSLTASLECQFKRRGLAQINIKNPNNFLSGLILLI